MILLVDDYIYCTRTVYAYTVPYSTVLYINIGRTDTRYFVYEVLVIHGKTLTCNLVSASFHERLCVAGCSHSGRIYSFPLDTRANAIV